MKRLSVCLVYSTYIHCLTKSAVHSYTCTMSVPSGYNTKGILEGSGIFLIAKVWYMVSKTLILFKIHLTSLYLYITLYYRQYPVRPQLRVLKINCIYCPVTIFLGVWIIFSDENLYWNHYKKLTVNNFTLKTRQNFDGYNINRIYTFIII